MAESFKTRAAPRPCDASARRRQSTTPRQEACRGAVVVVVRKPSSVPRPGRPSAGGNHSSRANVAVRFVSGQPRGSERAALPTFRLASFVVASLCGLAPDGVCRAVPVTGHAVGSYPTLSPLPRRRWRHLGRGGLLSVALSSRSPSPGVTRRLALWSSDFPPVAPGSATGDCLDCYDREGMRPRRWSRKRASRRDAQLKYSSKTGCSASSSRRARNFFFARLSSCRARSRETPRRRPISASESSSSSSAIMRTSTM